MSGGYRVEDVECRHKKGVVMSEEKDKSKRKADPNKGQRQRCKKCKKGWKSFMKDSTTWRCPSCGEPMKNARTLRLPVWPTNKEDWPRVRKLFDLTHRAAYLLSGHYALSQSAIPGIGGKIEALIPPSKKDSKATLDLLLGGNSREWFQKKFGDVLTGDHYDFIIAAVSSRMGAKDPDKPGLSRDYLILNGERRAPLLKNCPVSLRMRKDVKTWPMDEGGHKVTMKLPDGPLQFSIGKVDPMQWRIFRAIIQRERDGGDPWTFHRVRATSHKPEKLWLNVVYFVGDDEDTQKKIARARHNRGREMEINFLDDPENFMRCLLRSGHERNVDERLHWHDSALAALAQIDRLAARQERQHKRIKACGSYTCRKEGAGHRKAYRREAEISKKLTKARESCARGWNHTWTARLVRQAEQWECGRIAVYDLPEDLLGRPWQWSNFKFDLEYKAREVGIEVEWRESPKVEDVVREAGA